MKKVISILLASSVLLSAVPFAAAASENTPIVEDATIYGNGSALLIMQEKEGTTVYLDADSDGVLDEGELSLQASSIVGAPEDGADLSGWTVCGGAKDTTVDSAKITMTGGSVQALWAGSPEGSVTGEASLAISGGTISEQVVMGQAGTKSLSLGGTVSIGGENTGILLGGDDGISSFVLTAPLAGAGKVNLFVSESLEAGEIVSSGAINADVSRLVLTGPGAYGKLLQYGEEGKILLAADPALTPDTAWYSEEETQFTLSDPRQLAGLASLVNEGNTFAGKTVKLSANLNFAGWQWIPIGNTADHPFLGTFDGQNRTLSNITVSGAEAAGLFGYTYQAAGEQEVQAGAVKNVILSDTCYFQGTAYAGGISAVAGNMDNCRNYGTVKTSAGTAGGLAGQLQGVLTNGVNTGTVTAETAPGTAGGLVGEITGTAAVKNSYHTGVVSAKQEESTLTLKRAGGDVPSLGGLVGKMTGGALENCYSRGTLEGGDPTATGGLVGTAVAGAVSYGYWEVQSGITAAVGKKEEGVTLTSLGSFSGTSGTLTATDGTTLSETFGTNLRSALTAWVNSQEDKGIYKTWYNGKENYPSFDKKPSTGGGSSYVEVTVNPDGSVTTITRNIYQNTAEEETVYPNGALVKAHIDEKGDVTATVTIPEGVEHMLVAFSAGNGTVAQNLDHKKVQPYSFVKDGKMYVRVEENGSFAALHKENYFLDTFGHWAEESADFTTARELFVGTAQGVFSPNLNMTRAMLVTVLYRLAGSPAVKTSAGFTDVPKNAYYADAVNWAAEEEILAGISGKQFKPKQDITREELASYLCGYAKLVDAVLPSTGYSLSDFTDGDKVSDFALEGMEWAVNMGMITGTDEDHLTPQGTATRAQVSVILQRFIQGVLDSEIVK